MTESKLPQRLRSIRITSNGLTHCTKVMDAETGEEIRGVTKVEWWMGLNDISRARIEVRGVEIDAKGWVSNREETFVDIWRAFAKLSRTRLTAWRKRVQERLLGR